MRHGLCHIPLAPGRKEATDTSEMVTEILFGEAFQILEKLEKWSYIKLLSDDYECWIDNKQYEPIFADMYDELLQKPVPLVAELVGKVNGKSGQMLVPMGSSLPFFNKGTVKIGKLEFTYNGRLHPGNNLSEIAQQFVNVPYLWGGKSMMGIDCSGFTQTVYAVCGKKLPRDAYQQAERGESIDFIDEAREGDLAFFDNEEGKIIHVGLLLGNNKIIHASGRVRVDKIDHQGIFNEEKNTYSHNLRIIKRIN